MSLPTSAYLQFTADMKICRILNGLWQVSGAHGAINPEVALNEMFSYGKEGFTTWDLADHYGPAEDFVGEFRQRLSTESEALKDVHFFTKWVPRPTLMTPRVVAQSIRRSLQRMRTETLDLLQFHWWDYQDEQYLVALTHLATLCEEGAIRHLALTNFDTPHLSKIIAQGIKIVSNQVQYSLIDMRPSIEMESYCQEQQIWLLPYGTLCGGLLSEKYLGQPEPPQAALTTASLRKYKQMIDMWGGWALFQQLLWCVKQIADKHKVSMANVAIRYILDRPRVAGVIIGTRLSISEHIQVNKKTFEMALDDEDREQIAAVQAKANNLSKIIGDCGAEYR